MHRQDSRPAPAAEHRASQRIAWFVFAPPAALVGLRWMLQLADDRQPAAPALPLVPVTSATDAIDLLWPAVAALALLAAFVWFIRRRGWRRVMPAVGAAWLLLWLAGSGALLHRHLNRQGLFFHVGAASAAPAVGARVIGARLKPASLRSLGGIELVLQVSGLQVPQRLLVDMVGAAGPAQPRPGDTLALQLAPGRFSGVFVTGWQLEPAVSP